MIISHDHRLIFIKTKKTAGTSFEIALSRFCGEQDTLTPISEKDELTREEMGFAGPRNYNLVRKNGETRKVKLYNHIDALSLKRVLDPDIWKSYRKIAIIRDPYDCLVSWYYWSVRGKKRRPSFWGFLAENPYTVVENFKMLKVKGRSVIDNLIYYEDLKGGIENLEQEVPSLAGLYSLFSGINAKGDVRPKENIPTTGELFESHPKAFELVRLLLEDEDLAASYLK